MRARNVTTIIKGLTYNIPVFKLKAKGELHQVESGNLPIKFCNERNGLQQEGVNPNHLLAVVSNFIEDEEYPYTEEIQDLLNTASNLIKNGQKRKGK